MARMIVHVAFGAQCFRARLAKVDFVELVKVASHVLGELYLLDYLFHWSVPDILFLELGSAAVRALMIIQAVDTILAEQCVALRAHLHHVLDQLVAHDTLASLTFYSTRFCLFRRP